MGSVFCRCGWCSICLLAIIPQFDGPIQNVRRNFFEAGFSEFATKSGLGTGINSNSFSRYIQMSAMIFGGMIEADSRMMRYQQAVRSHKKLQTDMAVWRAYENEFEERGTPGVAAESKVQGKSVNE